MASSKMDECEDTKEEVVCNDDKKPQFGNRHLTNKQDVFKHNAWDDVEWDDDLEKEAERKVSANSRVLVDDEMQLKYEEEANQFWDRFYEIHQNRFFKDRHWLHTEFPELRNGEKSEEEESFDNKDSSDEQKEKINILEVGCGVGNTVFPILEHSSNNQRVFVYCCDFSKTALDVLKSNELYDPRRCCAFYCDLSKDEWETPFAEASLDIVILVFVLSAVHPDRMQRAVCNLVKYLKPGGVVLLRDYGRYDMAQLRFKSGRCLSDNFYVRGDGTRVFFFTRDEIRKLFTEAGLVEEQNLVDRRLQVNRGKQLTMYRVWIQCKYRKPCL